MLAQTFHAILSSQSTRDFALCPVMPSRSRGRDSGKRGAGGSDSTGSEGKGSKAFLVLATAAATVPVPTATAAAMDDHANTMSSKGKKGGYGGSDSYGSTSKGSKADGYGGSDSYGSKGSGQCEGQLSPMYLSVKSLRPEAEMVAEQAEMVAEQAQMVGQASGDGGQASGDGGQALAGHRGRAGVDDLGPSANVAVSAGCPNLQKAGVSRPVLMGMTIVGLVAAALLA